MASSQLFVCRTSEGESCISSLQPASESESDPDPESDPESDPDLELESESELESEYESKPESESESAYFDFVFWLYSPHKSKIMIHSSIAQASSFRHRFLAFLNQ